MMLCLNRQTIGHKTLSNHREIVGAKFVVIVNNQGRIVRWLCASASCRDSVFCGMIDHLRGQMIVLADQGFHGKEGDPDNLLVCKRAQWNEGMLIETIFSLFTRVLGIKKLSNRMWPRSKRASLMWWPPSTSAPHGQVKSCAFHPLINPHHWL